MYAPSKVSQAKNNYNGVTVDDLSTLTDGATDALTWNTEESNHYYTDAIETPYLSTMTVKVQVPYIQVEDPEHAGEYIDSRELELQTVSVGTTVYEKETTEVEGVTQYTGYVIAEVDFSELTPTEEPTYVAYAVPVKVTAEAGGDYYTIYTINVHMEKPQTVASIDTVKVDGTELTASTVDEKYHHTVDYLPGYVDVYATASDNATVSSIGGITPDATTHIARVNLVRGENDIVINVVSQSGNLTVPYHLVVMRNDGENDAAIKANSLTLSNGSLTINTFDYDGDTKTYTATVEVPYAQREGWTISAQANSNLATIVCPTGESTLQLGENTFTDCISVTPQMVEEGATIYTVKVTLIISNDFTLAATGGLTVGNGTDSFEVTYDNANSQYVANVPYAKMNGLTLTATAAASTSQVKIDGLVQSQKALTLSVVNNNIFSIEVTAESDLESKTSNKHATYSLKINVIVNTDTTLASVVVKKGATPLTVNFTGGKYVVAETINYADRNSLNIAATAGVATSVAKIGGTELSTQDLELSYGKNDITVTVWSEAAINNIGEKQKTSYTVEINVTASENAALAATDGITIVNNGSPLTLEYSNVDGKYYAQENVLSSHSEITVTVAPAAATSQVTINGTNGTTKPVTLTAGSNTVAIVVLSEAAINNVGSKTTAQYDVVINVVNDAAGAEDCALKALPEGVKVGNYQVTQNGTTYNVNVPYSEKSGLTLEVKANATFAMVLIDNNGDSNSASKQLKLEKGENIYTVKVISESDRLGITSDKNATYTVNINVVGNQDYALAATDGIKVGSYTVEKGANNKFTVSIPYAERGELALEVKANATTSQIKIDEVVTSNKYLARLTAGPNTITVEVIAESDIIEQTTDKHATYTVEINVLANDNSSLATGGIVVKNDGTPLDVNYIEGEYVVDGVSILDKDKISVEVTAAASTSVVKIAGVETTSKELSLRAGENEIIITVLSEAAKLGADETKQTEYTLVINVVLSTDSSLATGGIVVKNDGTPLDVDYIEGKYVVDGVSILDKDKISVEVTAAASTSVVKIAGVETTSKELSLRAGENEIIITVLSEAAKLGADETKQTEYTLVINVVLSTDSSLAIINPISVAKGSTPLTVNLTEGKYVVAGNIVYADRNSLNLTARAKETTSVIQINGVEQSSAELALNIGRNEIVVTVLSESAKNNIDTTKKTDYIVVINVTISEDSTLAANEPLRLEKGSAKHEINLVDGKYVANIAYGDREGYSLSVFKNASTSLVQINGVEKTSENLTLNPGKNEYIVTVLSESAISGVDISKKTNYNVVINVIANEDSSLYSVDGIKLENGNAKLTVELTEGKYVVQETIALADKDNVKLTVKAKEVTSAVKIDGADISVKTLSLVAGTNSVTVTILSEAAVSGINKNMQTEYVIIITVKASAEEIAASDVTLKNNTIQITSGESELKVKPFVQIAGKSYYTLEKTEGMDVLKLFAETNNETSQIVSIETKRSDDSVIRSYGINDDIQITSDVSQIVLKVQAENGVMAENILMLTEASVKPVVVSGGGEQKSNTGLIVAIVIFAVLFVAVTVLFVLQLLGILDLKKLFSKKEKAESTASAEGTDSAE